MGTRSLTVVKNDFGECCVLYRQYDGYPTGHGMELKQFLVEFEVVSGLSLKTPKRIANGLDCLAAQLVAHFKKEAGGFYLCPSGTRDCGEEYIYTVYMKDGKLRLKIQGGAVTFFGLPGTKPENMPVLYDDEVEHFIPPLVEEDWKENRGKAVNDFLEQEKKPKEEIIEEEGYEH